MSAADDWERAKAPRFDTQDGLVVRVGDLLAAGDALARENAQLRESTRRLISEREALRREVSLEETAGALLERESAKLRAALASARREALLEAAGEACSLSCDCGRVMYERLRALAGDAP